MPWDKNNQYYSVINLERDAMKIRNICLFNFKCSKIQRLTRLSGQNATAAPRVNLMNFSLTQNWH